MVGWFTKKGWKNRRQWNCKQTNNNKEKQSEMWPYCNQWNKSCWLQNITMKPSAYLGNRLQNNNNKKYMETLKPLVHSNLHFYTTPVSHHLHSALLGAIQTEASKEMSGSQWLLMLSNDMVTSVCRSLQTRKYTRESRTWFALFNLFWVPSILDTGLCSGFI